MAAKPQGTLVTNKTGHQSGKTIQARGVVPQKSQKTQKGYSSGRKMDRDKSRQTERRWDRDAIATQRTKYQSDKAAEHKKQQQNRCKQRRTAQKTMVKDTPTAPPAPYAVVTKRGVCTLTNTNRFM